MITARMAGRVAAVAAVLASTAAAAAAGGLARDQGDAPLTACRSHNDCAGVRDGGRAHACFFASDRTGFCAPHATAGSGGGGGGGGGGGRGSIVAGGRGRGGDLALVEEAASREKRDMLALTGELFLEEAEGAATGPAATGGPKVGAAAVAAAGAGAAAEVSEAATGAAAAEADTDTDASASAAKSAADTESVAVPATPAAPVFGDGSLLLHADAGQNAMLRLSSGASQFSLGNKAGTLSLSHKGHGELLSVTSTGDVAFNAPFVHANSLHSASALSVKGVPQWRVAAHDAYEGDDAAASLAGWRPVPLPVAAGLTAPSLPIGVSTECNVAMLGGPGIFNQAGYVAKTFEVSSPTADYRQARVVADFHFIDSWTGQSAFLKYASPKAIAAAAGAAEPEFEDDQVAWTRQYSVTPRGPESMTKAKLGAVNVCGDPAVGEHLFAAHVDTLVPIVDGKVRLTFGTTWELQNGGVDTLPCSWGVSGLKLLVR